FPVLPFPKRRFNRAARSKMDCMARSHSHTQSFMGSSATEFATGATSFRLTILACETTVTDGPLLSVMLTVMRNRPADRAGRRRAVAPIDANREIGRADTCRGKSSRDAAEQGSGRRVELHTARHRRSDSCIGLSEGQAR